MTTLSRTLLVILATLSISSLTFALGDGITNPGSYSKFCHDIDGGVIVEDGNVTIQDGIGDVGKTLAQDLIRTIHTRTENCVDGTPNFSHRSTTVEKVMYAIEEGDMIEATVYCTTTASGIVYPMGICEL